MVDCGENGERSSICCRKLFRFENYWDGRTLLPLADGYITLARQSSTPLVLLPVTRPSLCCFDSICPLAPSPRTHPFPLRYSRLILCCHGHHDLAAPRSVSPLHCKTYFSLCSLRRLLTSTSHIQLPWCLLRLSRRSVLLRHHHRTNTGHAQALRTQMVATAAAPTMKPLDWW